jgi:outer membrane protein TolC
MASKAWLPTRKLQIAGLMKEPLELPSNSMFYLGTFSVNEAIFAGNKMRYAKRSADLLRKIAGLDQKKDKEEVIFTILQSYINLYKIDESLKIVAKNLADIQGRLAETIQFKEQGLATDNDVLRFKLQKANVALTQIDLQNNRQVANFAMDVMLGLPDNTVLMVDSISLNTAVPALSILFQNALEYRSDLAAYQYRQQLGEVSIKNIRADKLPTLGAGLSAYYLNPNQQFFPPENSYLVPVTLGLNLSWDISSLYTSKHKISEARIKLKETRIAERSLADNIRIEINKNYRSYEQAFQKIEVLNTAVNQAKENDRIMELKYKNQLATTTDRIDAEAMLYQSLINLELARADAAVAYFKLRESTGELNKQ